MAEESSKEVHCSFEEFKLIYESAEKVTDRRLARNAYNYSACVGVVLALAVIVNWSISNSRYTCAGFTLAILLSTLAAIYTRLWHRQILDFKALNTAKFRVLNDMAPLIRFESAADESNVVIASYEPFRREWEIMEDLKALQEKPKGGRRSTPRALKSTDAEMFIPNAFMAIFISTALVCLAAVVSSFSSFIQNWKNILIPWY